MAGSAQGAVDTLLGRLSSVLLEEAKLLHGVRGDVEFIKDEMMNMHGFLLDVAGIENPNHQVDAWAKQVKELAYDSQNCIDRYMQCLEVVPGAARGGGILATARRAPQLLRTVLVRHRIAMRIRELKARARDLGERRLRYDVAIREGMRASIVDPTTAAAAKGDDARQRALDKVTNFLEDDIRKVIGWLTKELPDQHPQRRLRIIAVVRRQYQEDEYPLVRKVYDHPSVSGSFRRAWINGTGTKYTQRKGALLHILQQLKIPHSGDMDEKKLAEKLKNHLRGSQFLIVAANDPYGSVWETVQSACSPASDESSFAPGSAILVTTWRPPPRQPFYKVKNYFYQNALMLDNDIREVIDWLTKELPDQHPQRRLRVIAVVRRQQKEDEYPLARKVYEHPSLSRSFDFKAWIKGRGTKYTQQGALLQVLNDLEVPHSADMNEEKLVEKLRDHLRGKRFLIVAANDLYESVREAVESACSNLSAADESSFPAGSAILVTTWKPLPPQEPSPFYKVKNYLQIVQFFYTNALVLVGDHDCDNNIKEILKKILMRRGWNFFSMEMFLRALYVKPNRSTEELQNLLNKLTPPTIATEMMEYCYNDLPSHYKSCLLYLSILFKRENEVPAGSPDHIKIKRTTIVRRLAAENFVTKRDEQSAIDEAECCFDELLRRGLVRPDEVGADGKVKTCTMHHRVLSFITKMAKEEGLVDVGTELPPDLARRLSIRNGISRQQRQPVNEKKYEKKVPQSTSCWKAPTPMDSSDESKRAVQVDYYTEAFLESLPVSSTLGLVQVLDLENFKRLRRHHLKEICNKMIQLKYLSLRNTGVEELPKDIEKLRYLETLDIRQTGMRTLTTKSIVLPKLVHLFAGQVEQHKYFPRRLVSTIHMPREIGSMIDLQILCQVVVSSSGDELVEVGRLQQLRKLGLVIRGKEIKLSHFLRVIERLNESLRSLSVKIELHSSKILDLSFGKMAFSPPKLLKSLNINGRITGLPIWIKSLRKLVKVALCSTCLMDNAIRMLGELVSLRCLRLWHRSYIETRLTFKNGEFQNLKYLLVEGSEVTNIHFGNGAAPKLEKIVWASSIIMETISGTKGLPSLKEIELHGDRRNCKLYSIIIKDMAEHKNNPVVTHRADYVAPNKPL